MKRIVTILLCFSIFFNIGSASATNTTKSIIDSSISYLYKRYNANSSDDMIKKLSLNPGDSVSDWLIITMKSCGIHGNYEIYSNALINHIKDKYKNNGFLSKNKATEYHRIILTLKACDIDATNIDSINLYDDGIFKADLDKQGISAYIWALIASEGVNNIDFQKEIINKLLSYELSSGGFSFSKKSKQLDVDLTSMALYALSCYGEEYNDIIKRTLIKLKDFKNDDGSFTNGNIRNSESTAQVLLLLSKLKSDNNDLADIIDVQNVFEGLMTFYNDENAFFHSEDDKTSNLISTYQSLYALSFYKKLNINSVEDNQSDTDYNNNSNKNNISNNETSSSVINNQENPNSNLNSFEINSDSTSSFSSDSSDMFNTNSINDIESNTDIYTNSDHYVNINSDNTSNSDKNSNDILISDNGLVFYQLLFLLFISGIITTLIIIFIKRKRK